MRKSKMKIPHAKSNSFKHHDKEWTSLLNEMALTVWHLTSTITIRAHCICSKMALRSMECWWKCHGVLSYRHLFEWLVDLTNFFQGKSWIFRTYLWIVPSKLFLLERLLEISKKAEWASFGAKQTLTHTHTHTHTDTFATVKHSSRLVC